MLCGEVLKFQVPISGFQIFPRVGFEFDEDGAILFADRIDFGQEGLGSKLALGI